MEVSLAIATYKKPDTFVPGNRVAVIMSHRERNYIIWGTFVRYSKSIFGDAVVRLDGSKQVRHVDSGLLI